MNALEQLKALFRELVRDMDKEEILRLSDDFGDWMDGYAEDLLTDDDDNEQNT